MFLRTNTGGPRGLGRRLALEALDERAVPAVIAVDDTYTVARGAVLTVDAQTGVLTNDFSNSDPGATLAAAQLGAVRFVGSNQAVPAGTLNLFANGGFQFIAPSDIPAGVSQIQFQYTATNLNPSNGVDPSGSATVTVNIAGAGNTRFVAAGAGAGGAPQVNVYQPGPGVLVRSFYAYDRAFTGGVRVAVGDLTGDGIDDIATAPGLGGSADIRVFSGKDGTLVFQQTFFEDTFRGGAYVAIGDVTGDGANELIIGAGEGGGSRVIVTRPDTSGAGVSPILADFFAYEPTYRNGVRVAAGDVTGTGAASVVTVPGAGGGPRVSVFDVNAIATSPDGSATPLKSFFSGNPGDRGGLFVSTGFLTEDRFADIVVGSTGGTASSTVVVYDGFTDELILTYNVPVNEVRQNGGVPTGPNAAYVNPLANRPAGSLVISTQTPTALAGNAVAFPAITGGGLTVTTLDINGDGFDEIITGAPAGYPPIVRTFAPRNNEQVANIQPFPDTFLGGVFVGS